MVVYHRVSDLLLLRLKHVLKLIYISKLEPAAFVTVFLIPVRHSVGISATGGLLVKILILRRIVLFESLGGR